MLVLKDGPSSATLRQAAMDDAMGNVFAGLQGMEKQKQTKRAEALALQDHTRKLREAGYDVNEQMVTDSLAPEPSGLSRFFGGDEQVKKPDLYANRTEEYKTKLASEAADKDRDARYKESQISKNNRYSPKSDKEKKESIYGEQLKPTEIAKFNEGNQIPNILNELRGVIDNNKDLFGPVSGRIASMNPWDEKGKTADSQIQSAAQTVGKYLEGGVLRAEDVPKYRKMLPDLTDTPEIAANKLANIERLLIQRQNSDISALKGSGYDVRSLDKGFVAPDAPAILSGNSRNGSWDNSARANDPAVMKQQLKSVSREEKIRMLRGK